jgi:ABC-type nitrate/sulfonate/bicarbonate transport system substrate-binding protein
MTTTTRGTGPHLRLAVPDLISNSYFPAVAAVELGFLADAGFEADIELIFPVSAAMDALRAGDVDLVAGAAHATLTAFPRWSGAKLLAALARHMYWFLVVRADLGVARGDVGSVKGLRIGAAPGVDLGLRQLLLDSGIDPDGDVEIAPVPGLGDGSVSFGVNAAAALQKGLLDGFWANGMGAEVAVREGTGSVVLDVRRGDGPAAARGYTFAALVATEETLRDRPEVAAAAVRGRARAQVALRADPGSATPIGRKLFPPREAELIAELIARDVPYYDAAISTDAVSALNLFAGAVGLPVGDSGYDDVVAADPRPLWSPNVASQGSTDPFAR